MGFLLWGVTTYPNLREQSSADLDTNKLKAFFPPSLADFTRKEELCCWNYQAFTFPFVFTTAIHSGCSPHIWERDTDPSVLGSNMEDYSQQQQKSHIVLFLMKCSQCLFCLQTAALAVLFLRDKCKWPFLLHLRLSLVTCRLSTCPASSINSIDMANITQKF